MDGTFTLDAKLNGHIQILKWKLVTMATLGCHRHTAQGAEADRSTADCFWIHDQPALYAMGARLSKLYATMNLRDPEYRL